MSAGWEEARNILCVRLDNMGDVLMTTPAIRALRESVPGRRLTLLASASGVALAPYLDCVDDAIGYAAPWVKQASSSTPEADRDMMAALATHQFDAAVVFTVYSQSPLPAALMCRLAGIPRVLAHCRENPYALLTDWIPETEPHERIRHEAQRQLDLVAHVGATTADRRLVFDPGDDARLRMRDVLCRTGIDAGTPYIVLHPGATAPSRIYPADSFATVARMLLREFEGHVLLTGTEDETARAEALRRAIGHPRVHGLAGLLDLGALGALLEDARVLIANNSGPVHLAAAVGTPVVDLYALTNPQHTPWMVPNRVLFRDVPCKYCYRSVCPAGHHACLAGIAPGEVVEATRAVWRREAAPC